MAAIVGAVFLFGNGFAGPAPLALALAGGLITAAVVLWRPSQPQRNWIELERSQNDPKK